MIRTATLTTFGTWFPRYTRMIVCPKHVDPVVVASLEAEALASQLDAADLRGGSGTVTAVVSHEGIDERVDIRLSA